MVVQLSKTTKNRHGQPNMNLWNTLVVRMDNHVYPRNNLMTCVLDLQVCPYDQRFIGGIATAMHVVNIHMVGMIDREILICIVIRN